jgi:hypothetical protein
MRTNEEIIEDYKKYRGKCKIMSEELVANDPTLTLIRGYYICPIWATREHHWWCIKQNGTIVDPTAKQFPSNGSGIYEPFNGIIECAECGKEVLEEDAKIHGNYAFCSHRCNANFLGIYI